MQEGDFSSLQEEPSLCLNSNRAQGLPSALWGGEQTWRFLRTPAKGSEILDSKAPRGGVQCSSDALCFPATVTQERGCQPDWALGCGSRAWGPPCLHSR